MRMNKQEIEEWVDYGVDSRYQSQKEERAASISLMEDRLERMRNLTDAQIIKAKLMQLKLQMEKFLDLPAAGSDSHFTDFLGIYIDILYSKRLEFAESINVSPTFLSQVINRHREPNRDFMLKLMVHSKEAFAEVSKFSEEIWYLVYFKQVVNNALATEDEWRPSIEKQVKFKRVYA